MACREKYKPCILKYKALILKYVPYIFRHSKHLINSNLQKLLIRCKFLVFSSLQKSPALADFLQGFAEGYRKLSATYYAGYVSAHVF